MKKILFFSRDPGAANCIIPVYQKIINDSNYQVELFGKDFALEKYIEEGLQGENITEYKLKIEEKDIKKFLQSRKYDLLVLGTSVDIIERLLCKVAKEIGIKTVVILDNWMNYKERFVLEGEVYFPDFYCVMDDIAKREAVESGVPESIIKVTGQPYFETVFKRQNEISDEYKKGIKNKLKLNKEKVIVFASEPIKESADISNRLGYDQIIIFKKFIDSLLKAHNKYQDKDIAVILRLHPRNQANIFEELLEKYNLKSNIKIIIDRELNSQEAISISDLVVGMSSMFLIESLLFGKKIMSIQIGLKEYDPFVLNRFGKLKSILNEEELEKQLESMVFNENDQNIDFNVIYDASNNIINLINKICYE